MLALPRFFLSCLALGAAVHSFSVLPHHSHRATTTLLAADRYGDNSSTGGSVVRLEFKIHSDGRVEEIVRGVKGGDCHKVTEKINEMLGEVIASAPTEEMYEQELIVTEKVSLNNNNGWDGISSW